MELAWYYLRSARQQQWRRAAGPDTRLPGRGHRPPAAARQLQPRGVQRLPRGRGRVLVHLEEGGGLQLLPDHLCQQAVPREALRVLRDEEEGRHQAGSGRVPAG